MLLLLTVNKLKETRWCSSKIRDSLIKRLISLSCTSKRSTDLVPWTLLTRQAPLNELLQMNLLDKLIQSFILVELSPSLFVLLVSYSADHCQLIILTRRIIALIIHCSVESSFRRLLLEILNLQSRVTSIQVG